MTWLIIILVVIVLLYVPRLFNKRIDATENKRANRNETSLWDGLCLKFRKYLDFTQKSMLSDRMEIANQKGETITFQKALTDIIVTYKLNGKVEKTWKFPFWVAIDTAFKAIDDYYISSKELKIYEEQGITSIYSLNGKYGLWNPGYTTPVEKERLTDAIYEEINDKYVYARGWNRLITVKKDGLYGIINLHGQTMLECRYDLIESYNIIDDYTTAIYNDLTLYDENRVKSDLLNEWIKANTTKGELDSQNAIEEAFNIILCRDNFTAIKNSKYGVVSYYDIEILPFIYDKIEWVNDYLFIVTINGKYGIVWNNKVIVPCEYTKIAALNNNMFGTIEGGLDCQLFRVQMQNSTEAVINGNGKLIIPFMDSQSLEQQIYRLLY